MDDSVAISSFSDLTAEQVEACNDIWAQLLANDPKSRLTDQNGSAIWDRVLQVRYIDEPWNSRTELYYWGPFDNYIYPARGMNEHTMVRCGQFDQDAPLSVRLFHLTSFSTARAPFLC